MTTIYHFIVSLFNDPNDLKVVRSIKENKSPALAGDLGGG